MNKSDEQQSTPVQKTAQEKKRYTRPQFICYGDVRDVTLGGSPGTGDSGGSMSQQP